MTRSIDWSSIRLSYLRGETPYRIAKTLGDHPCRQWIAKTAKAEGWDQGMPGVVAESHLRPHPNSPSKDSPERRERVLAILKDGGTYRLAAAAIGVHENTLSAWRKGDVEFQRLCDAAQADFALGQLAKVRTSLDTKDARFLLERHPMTRDDYGQPKERHSAINIVLGIHRDAVVPVGLTLDQTPEELPFCSVEP